MNWNLMVSFNQTYRGEYFPASKLLWKFGNLPNGILDEYRPRIQGTIFAIGSPAFFFLGDEVEGRSPGAIGTPSSAVSKHRLELVFRDS